MGLEESLGPSLTAVNSTGTESFNSMSFSLLPEPSLRKSTRPLTRRRTNSLSKRTDEHSESVTRRSGHSRSQSEYGGHHPLRSATSDHAGITRPHLERMVNALDSNSSSQADEEISWLDERNAEHVSMDSVDERVVLVHEVSPNDSLPGVALKYGITMAELRKVNQLWASDPIHLRKILYIPVTSRNDVSPSHSDGDKSTIRRIPASQLSFFPPSSKSLDYSSDDLGQVPPMSRLSAETTSSSYSSAPLSLSSIWSSLPIIASTRETIISRLSFESSTNASDDGEHELSDVHTPSPKPPPTRNGPTSRARAISHRKISVPKSPPRNSPRLSWAPPPEPEPQQSAIRTVQLEPSPSMKMPRHDIAVPSVNGKRCIAEGNGDLEGSMLPR